MMTLTTVDLYERGQKDYHLSQAIIQEYTHWGYCYLVDCLLEDNEAMDDDTYEAILTAGIRLGNGYFRQGNTHRQTLRDLKELGQLRHREIMESKTILKNIDYDRHWSGLGLLTMEQQENLQKYADVDRDHSQMVEASSQIQAQWAGNLEGFRKTLNTMQDELYAYLRDWQKSLYPRDLEPLGRCFTSLYRMIPRGEALLAELTPTVSPEALAGLTKFQHNLKILLRKLEEAMIPLGIQTYMPEPGSYYEPEYHEALNMENPPDNATILRTLSPVLLKTTVPTETPDVLIPAQVEVKAK